MKHIIIILLLSVSIHSSNVKLTDVRYANQIKISFDKEETRKSIQAYTKTFHDYLEGLYGSLPILTLKEKEWLEKETKRTKNNDMQMLELSHTYIWKLNRTYEDLEFYIKEFKEISEGDNIKHMMYDLTKVMNTLRNPYSFEYIQSFVRKKKMPLSALGIYKVDVYVSYFELIIDDYFDKTLLEYMSTTDFYVDDFYMERFCPKYMRLKKDKK